MTLESSSTLSDFGDEDSGPAINNNNAQSQVIKGSQPNLNKETLSATCPNSSSSRLIEPPSRHPVSSSSSGVVSSSSLPADSTTGHGTEEEEGVVDLESEEDGAALPDEDDEDYTPRVPVEVTEDMVRRLHSEKWGHVNGNYDSLGNWREWYETLSVTNDLDGEPFVILPYVHSLCTTELLEEDNNEDIQDEQHSQSDVRLSDDPLQQDKSDEEDKSVNDHQLLHSRMQSNSPVLPFPSDDTIDTRKQSPSSHQTSSTSHLTEPHHPQEPQHCNDQSDNMG